MAAGTAVIGEMTVSIQIDGIMIFNEGNGSLDDAVREAAGRYKERTGQRATHCGVPIGAAEEGAILHGVCLVPQKKVSTGYLLIGVEAGHGK